MKRYQVIMIRAAAIVMAMLCVILAIGFTHNNLSVSDAQTVGIVIMATIFGWVLIGLSVHFTPSKKIVRKYRTMAA